MAACGKGQGHVDGDVFLKGVKGIGHVHEHLTRPAMAFKVRAATASRRHLRNCGYLSRRGAVRAYRPAAGA